MRIIAGTLKGRRLTSPGWPGLRPTSDKLRETLFNIIGARVVNARVLDGYAGTGAIGIEALSRGAVHVTFVDRDRRAAALIEANLLHCGRQDGYAIIRVDFIDLAPTLATEAFDIIVLDPPYGAIEMTSALAAASGLASPDTLVVIEHARRDPPPAEAGTLRLTRDVTSGDSALAFYRTV